jgi:hypothetical protein
MNICKNNDWFIQNKSGNKGMDETHVLFYNGWDYAAGNPQLERKIPC